MATEFTLGVSFLTAFLRLCWRPLGLVKLFDKPRSRSIDSPLKGLRTPNSEDFCSVSPTGEEGLFGAVASDCAFEFLDTSETDWEPQSSSSSLISSSSFSPVSSESVTFFVTSFFEFPDTSSPGASGSSSSSLMSGTSSSSQSESSSLIEVVGSGMSSGSTSSSLIVVFDPLWITPSSSIQMVCR